MVARQRTRDVPGLGRVSLTAGEQYVAGRTIVDKAHLPCPVMVIVNKVTGQVVKAVSMGGPYARRDAIKAVGEFNRIVDMRSGRW